MQCTGILLVKCQRAHNQIGLSLTPRSPPFNSSGGTRSALPLPDGASHPQGARGPAPRTNGHCSNPPPAPCIAPTQSPRADRLACQPSALAPYPGRRGRNRARSAVAAEAAAAHAASMRKWRSLFSPTKSERRRLVPRAGMGAEALNLSSGARGFRSPARMAASTVPVGRTRAIRGSTPRPFSLLPVFSSSSSSHLSVSRQVKRLWNKGGLGEHLKAEQLMTLPCHGEI